MWSDKLPERVWRVSFAVLSMLALWMAMRPDVPAHAEGYPDDAARIDALARIVYYDDLLRENQTYWINGNLGADPGGKPGRLLVGKPLPDFAFVRLAAGGRVTRDDLQPPYLINFWASWCPPCRDEFPLLTESLTNGKLDIPVLFVNVSDRKADAVQFLKTLTVPLPGNIPSVMDDVRQPFIERYHIDSIPQTLLIDADGTIQAIHAGEMTPITLDFFAEIAKHPGVGSFDADNLR